MSVVELSDTSDARSVTTFAYTPTTVTVTDAENRATTYEYTDFSGPAQERLKQVTDAAAQTTTYRYDVLNQLTHVTVPGVPTRVWVYDGTRLMSETQPESGAASYGYDAAGNRTSKSDALGMTTVFRYDTSNRLWQIDPPGTADDVTFTFDPVYSRISQQTSSSVTTSIGYDAAGRPSSRADTFGGTTYTSNSTFDANDLLRTITYPSGRVVTYEFDTARRLNLANHNGAAFADLFAYGDTGALASYRTGGVTHTFTPDDRDRLQRTTAIGLNGQGLDLTYGYDGVSQVTSIQDARSGQSQTFGYDSVGRLRSAIGPYGVREWTYHASGDRLTEIAGGTATYTYDAATRRLSSISGAAAESFTYNALGRLEQDARGQYQYNTHGLLTQATAPGLTATHAFDASGLRASRTLNGVTTVTVRGLANQVLSEYVLGCGAPQWTRDHVYAGGQLLGAVRGNLTFTFSDDPVQAGATPVRAAHVTELRAAIDTLRCRDGVARVVWTDATLTPGVTPVRGQHLVDLRTALTQAYQQAGQTPPTFTDDPPVAGVTPLRAVHVAELRQAIRGLQPTPEAVQHYGRDALGSIRVVFDATGAIVGRTDYAPFGEELAAATGMPKERFAGMPRDGETGQDYAQARMYGFRFGRFNAPDAIQAGLLNSQKWNRYTYALNSPITYSDRTGLDPQLPTNCDNAGFRQEFPTLCVPNMSALPRPMSESTIVQLDLLPPPASMVIVPPKRKDTDGDEDDNTNTTKIQNCSDFVQELTTLTEAAIHGGRNSVGWGMMATARQDPWAGHRMLGFKEHHLTNQGPDFARHVVFHAGSVLAAQTGGSTASIWQIATDVTQLLQKKEGALKELQNDFTGLYIGEIMLRGVIRRESKAVTSHIKKVICQ